ncbi:hypothetical protein WOLCODRAFT_131539 [Wolfiporia cocos MD-104 SS10]|uniref:Uncharacterized protein n=1 Tax=Wolfiporia cocos (strain MD-104) TaxID=742152 RepID=A0A2H3JF03_WOLCO|nr:hypothetical protein WOLCODRAFT_131539 [Wolfiporia cocos MD-104 SS10]
MNTGVNEMNSQQSTPELPLEILMDILETAAAISHDAAKTVSLVSSWARTLALPYVFCTIILRRAPLTAVQISSATRSPSSPRMTLPRHLGQFVRNLWIESTSMTLATSDFDIFRICPNLESVALKSAMFNALAFQTMPMHRETGVARENMFPSSIRHITLIKHTLRNEWRCLVDLRAPNGNRFLHNITHLHMLDMRISQYVPHVFLPHLTHLAMPYLDLGNVLNRGALRLPDGVLEHRSLRMIVLTLDEKKYLRYPWYGVEHYSHQAQTDEKSPRRNFADMKLHLQRADERVYIVLWPEMGRDACQEWGMAARDGENIWDKALRSRNDKLYGGHLPNRSERKVLTLLQ